MQVFRHESGGTGRLACFKLRKRSGDVDRAVRYIVWHAYHHTSHYRRLLNQAGLSPARIRGARDLRLVPVTTRDLIMENSWRSILSDRAVESKCRRALTSGSTGTLLAIHMTRIEAYYRRLLLLRAFFKNLGTLLPLRIAEVGPRHKSAPDDLIQRIGLVQVIYVRPSEVVTEEARRVRSFQPHVITGPPSCLEVLADSWVSADRDGGGLRLILCRGEVLSCEARRRLAEVFQCRVVDYYNCEEVGNVAWECPDHPGYLHVNTDACIVEIVDQRGRHVPPGEEGTVLVTSLFSCTMPFIRYSLGDRARLVTQGTRPCTCGSKNPLMSSPSGRDEDFLVLPDGRRVSPRTIDNMVGHTLHSWIGDQEFSVRYRVVQEAVDFIRVEVIAPHENRSNLEGFLGAKCRELHADLRCQLDFVERFSGEGSGKFRRVMSRVS